MQTIFKSSIQHLQPILYFILSKTVCYNLNCTASNKKIIHICNYLSEKLPSFDNKMLSSAPLKSSECLSRASLFKLG